MSDGPNQRLRLGQGSSTSELATLWTARTAFLRAIAVVEPGTYATLVLDDHGDAPDVVGVVRYWQAKYNLRDEWFADVAVRTMRRDYTLRRSGFVRHEARPAGPFVIPHLPSATASGRVFGLPLEAMYWNPEMETRADARARIMALVDAELKRIEVEGGEPRTTTKTPDHFLWLARYQVLEDSALNIAAEMLEESDYEMTVKGKARGVEKALKETAELIGLTFPRDVHDTLPLAFEPN